MFVISELDRIKVLNRKDFLTLFNLIRMVSHLGPTVLKKKHLKTMANRLLTSNRRTTKNKSRNSFSQVTLMVLFLIMIIQFRAAFLNPNHPATRFLPRPVIFGSCEKSRPFLNFSKISFAFLHPSEMLSTG